MKRFSGIDIHVDSNGSVLRSKRQVRHDAVHNLVGDIRQPIGNSKVSGICGVKPVAARTLRAGEVVFQEKGDILERPTMHSVQISETGHVHLRGEGRFLAHSFSPNCKIRIDELSSHPIDIVSLRHIDEGETLSFNYCTTEWDMAAPFEDSETRMIVRGFRYLSEQERIACLDANLLPPHIMRLWLREIFACK